MSFRRGTLRCNYCKRAIKVVPKADWWIYADNTQVAMCNDCRNSPLEDDMSTEMLSGCTTTPDKPQMGIG